MNGLTTLSNIEPLLRWIPAPALDPDGARRNDDICRHAGLDPASRG
jgi:hypothetical protein